MHKMNKLPLVLFLLFFSTQVGWARYGESHPRNAKKDFEIDKIKVEGASKGHSGFSGFETRGLESLSQSAEKGDWVSIEVDYKSRVEWADELVIQFYILTEKNVVLKGGQTQMNVQDGKRHIATAYLHPNTVARFGAIQKIAVVILYHGQEQDLAQWPMRTKKDWWNSGKTIEGQIKNVFQTPFIINQPENYEDIKWP